MKAVSDRIITETERLKIRLFYKRNRIVSNQQGAFIMGKLCELALVSLALLALLHTDSTWAKRSGSSSSSKKSSSNNRGSEKKPSKTSNTQTGSYPRQPQSPNRNPNSYPAGAAGYPNQNPGRGGVNPGYPAGGYPVRGGNTGQGWGQAGGYPGGGMGGGYQPNWNPNNKILSPRYGGGYGYGGGHGGMGGGSPFSRSVQGMGHYPSTQSKGFAKKALMAAGVGAVAGMAIGYGLGRFPRPHFNFRNPQEEQSYNNYMYSKYGERSTDENDYGRDYTYKVPPRAESYDSFMDTCMKRNDLLQDQGSDSQATPNNQRNNPQVANSQSMPITPEVENSSPASNQEGTDTVKPLTPAHVEIAGEGKGKEEDDGPTVSIEEIGYPVLVEQLKNRKCVELYMNYSERFLEKQTAERSSSGSNNNNNNKYENSHSNPLGQGLVQLITTLLMVLSSTLLLQ
ncbi:hypothetical protein J4Q44_G00133850 [Coregonus suidteri]|uniref:Prion protein n=1 Tax=Coregonus suidteri TaxID=861788 RepID=A0AAN8QXN7_9TELE